MSTENKPEAEAQAPAQQVFQVEVDDHNVSATYANFCRVTGSPEELIIDFGLNPQPVGVPKGAIPVTQRVIVNYFTAKRLFQLLGATIQQYEQTYGVLEIDVNKRVRPRTGGAAS
jgi:hypothetical protein